MLNRQNSLRAVEGLAAWLRQAELWVPAAANLCNPPPSLHKFIQRTGVSEGQEGESARAVGASGLKDLMYTGGSRELLVPDRACHW